MGALKELFELDFDPEQAASGPAFRTHSKDRGDYSPEQRQEERERGLAMHAREIGIVMQWAEQLAAHAKVPLVLPARLVL